MPNLKQNKPPTLEELTTLREEIIKCKEQGKKIINHYTELEKYYEDLEDRIYKIELKVQQLEKDTGLDADTIAEYDALAEVSALIGE